MSQTLREGWLRRLLGGNAQEAGGHLEIYNEQGVEIGQELQALRQTSAEQAALIGQLKHQLRMATSSQAAMAKRIQRLADDWPALFQRYFTKLGDQDRAEGKKTRSRRKAKRRTA